MKVKSEREVAQSCLTSSDPMDCSLRGSSVHGIFQAGVLEWVPSPSPRFSLVAGNGSYSLVAVRGLPIAMASLVAEHGL